MSIFKIEGGHRLKGDIVPQGAKNEALQIVCATLLTASKITISNIPDIRDVNKLIFILGELGVKIEKIDKNTYTFQADDIDLDYLETLRFKKDGSSLRGSIMIVGPLLTRFGKGYIPRPGGDHIRSCSKGEVCGALMIPTATAVAAHRPNQTVVESDYCLPATDEKSPIRGNFYHLSDTQSASGTAPPQLHRVHHIR